MRTDEQSSNLSVNVFLPGEEPVAEVTSIREMPKQLYRALQLDVRQNEPGRTPARRRTFAAQWVVTIHREKVPAPGV